jgi:hypothetical protein
MFNYLKKTRIRFLEDRYVRLLKQSNKLRAYNRREADKIKARANEIFQKIVKLETTI